MPSALKEWRKLDSKIQDQFRKKLRQVVINPHVPSMRMRGAPNTYRIKARSAGYRLVYEVEDRTVTVFVLAVDQRERGEVFETALRRGRERRDQRDD